MAVPPALLEGKLVAFFHQSTDLYGSDRVLLDLAAGVQSMGGRAVVVVPGTGLLTREFQARGIEFHPAQILKLSRSMFNPFGLVRLVGQVFAALRSYDRVFSNRRVDIVHSNTVAVLGGALWAWRRRIPHLWHVHEIIEHPRAVARVMPLLVRGLAQRVVCNSRATRRWLVAQQPTLEDKTEVILNGVQMAHHVDPAAVAALRASFLPNGARLAVGLVGRINRWKGQGLLLDAADLLYSRGVTDFSIVLKGSAPPGQESFLRLLQQRIARSPMREQVVLHDFSSDIWPVYAALDIACVPSIEPEPFGLVAVEAMAMGKPLVAADHGGLSDIVVHGLTGLMVVPGDIYSLAAAIEALLGDALMRARMGHAGKARFESCFAVDSMLDRFAHTWLRTMNGSA